MSPLALRLAAALAIGLGLFHSVLGERYILIRLFRRELPKLFGSDDFTKRTLRFAWHLTTLAWWGFALLLVMIADDSITSREVASVVVDLAALSGVVALIASRGQHLSWVAFFAIAGLVYAAFAVSAPP